MRISDWSSDLCSSDLLRILGFLRANVDRRQCRDFRFQLRLELFDQRFGVAHAESVVEIDADRDEDLVGCGVDRAEGADRGYSGVGDYDAMDRADQQVHGALAHLSLLASAPALGGR